MPSRLQVLTSSVDASVNFIEPIRKNQALESRHVQRDIGHFICYLSSQTACSAGCKFCHLTATGQTVSRDATVDEMVEQARRVLGYHEKYSPNAKTTREVSFSFMARGEPLASCILVREWQDVAERLTALATTYGYKPHFKLSTIFPRKFAWNCAGLHSCFDALKPRIYWSCYSANPGFLRYWMPAAIPTMLAARALTDYAEAGGEVTVHHCLIECPQDPERGNATPKDLEELLTVLRPTGLLRYARFNLVRYNAHPSTASQEASREAIELRLEALRAELGAGRVQEVSRVGPDVYASCGMFASGDA